MKLTAILTAKLKAMLAAPLTAKVLQQYVGGWFQIVKSSGLIYRKRIIEIKDSDRQLLFRLAEEKPVERPNGNEPILFSSTFRAIHLLKPYGDFLIRSKHGDRIWLTKPVATTTEFAYAAGA